MEEGEREEGRESKGRGEGGREGSRKEGAGKTKSPPLSSHDHPLATQAQDKPMNNGEGTPTLTPLHSHRLGIHLTMPTEMG